MGQKPAVVEFEGYAYQQGQEGLWYRACPKCGGGGDHWATWVHNGVCFKCGGHKVVGKGHTLEGAEKHAAGRAKAKAARDAKRAAEQAERADEAHAAWLEQKAAEEAVEAARAAARAEFQWLGEEGEKVEFAGEVVVKKGVETRYGWTVLVVVKVAENVEVKMFTTAAWLENVGEGDKVALNAVVKEHEVYEGKKATLVARPKLIPQEVAV